MSIVEFRGAGIKMPRKRRRKGGGRRQRIRRLAGEVQRDEVWRVRHLTASVDPGEAVALVGLRGAGQQAILRLAAGTLRPDEGTVTRSTTIVPMIEIAKAMSRTLSLRQNIYLIAGLYGMSSDEVQEKLGSIVEFAGLQQVLDRYLQNVPFVVRQRLAWSTAMHDDGTGVALDASNAGVSVIAPVLWLLFWLTYRILTQPPAVEAAEAEPEQTRSPQAA